MSLWKVLSGNSNNLPSDKVEGHAYLTIDDQGWYIDAKDANGALARMEVNPRSDWSESQPTARDYIKNKPTKLSEFDNDLPSQKVYDTIGNNTDGGMTQKAVTDALNAISASNVSVNGTTLVIKDTKLVSYNIEAVDGTLYFK